MWKWLWAFKSRKVQVAVVTVITAVLAQYGLNVDDSIVYTILAAGASVIGGIALEDAGQKLGGGPLE